MVHGLGRIVKSLSANWIIRFFYTYCIFRIFLYNYFYCSR
jgi:hypothetical protein